MPNCFQLTRKSDLDAGPVSLSQINREMCIHFNVHCDSRTYHAFWFDIIGLGLACGRSFDVQLKEFQVNAVKAVEQEDVDYWEHMIAICEWLDTHFTADSWTEVGRR